MMCFFIQLQGTYKKHEGGSRLANDLLHKKSIKNIANTAETF